jgi:hypothetical protein
MCQDCSDEDFTLGWFDRVMLKSGVIVRVIGLSHYGLIQAEHEGTGRRSVHRYTDIGHVISHRRTY